MSTVKLAGNGFGGVYEGAFGTYQSASDGSFTVDTRDAPSCLARGMAYLTSNTNGYSTINAPAAASATAFIASTTLSNGTVAVTQPGVMRPGSLVITGLASPGPSAGTIALAYIGNDGVATTDGPFSAVTVGVTPLTYFTTKGMAHITSVTVAGLVGSGYFTFGSTTALSVPVAPNAIDVSYWKETIESGDETVGTPSTTILGSIVPSAAPNASHIYSWMYTYQAPVV
jgi:hypothetical protein